MNGNDPFNEKALDKIIFILKIIMFVLAITAIVTLFSV
jgi:hypothetical protein